MSVIAATNLNDLLDALGRAWLKLLGSSSSGASKANGFGLGELSGTYGAYDAVSDAMTALAAIGSADVAGDLLPVGNRYRDSLSTAAIFGAKTKAFLAAIDRHCARFGGANYSNLETYLKYLNTGGGGTWTALQDGLAWRDLYYAVKGAYPSNYNCYYEVLQGTTDAEAHLSTNALGKFLVSGAGAGAFTDGVAIDSTKYAGGVGSLKVSGLAGSGNVTVTGIGFDPATRAVTTSKTWITSVTGNGDTAIVVGAGTAPANCLLIDVTNVSIAAGITAGTIYVEAKRPSGRPLLPA